MGWFSDMMFGKRKKLDIDVMNEKYKAYTDFMGEQEGIARQMMDPKSMLNFSQQNFLRQNQYDFANMQNRQLQKVGAMTCMSPGQTTANIMANMNTMRGDANRQFQEMLFNQYDKGLGLLQGVGQMKLGEANRQGDLYMAQINAHNARRQANMQLGVDAVGMAVGMV